MTKYRANVDHAVKRMNDEWFFIADWEVVTLLERTYEFVYFEQRGMKFKLEANKFDRRYDKIPERIIYEDNRKNL